MRAETPRVQREVPGTIVPFIIPLGPELEVGTARDLDLRPFEGGFVAGMDFFAITGFITLPLFFMSSAFAPLNAMPGWMQAVARANPLTYAINAMRHLVIDGWSASLPGDLLVLFAFASACLLLGTAAFQRHPV